MEMIAEDFVAEKYNLFDKHLERKANLHLIIKRQVDIFLEKMKMLAIIKEHKDLTIKELFCLLKKEGFHLKILVVENESLF